MLVFEGRLLHTEPWTEVLWIYDQRTDEGFREQLREEMWEAGASTEDGSCTTEAQTQGIHLDSIRYNVIFIDNFFNFC